MIELPESITLARQMTKELKGKRVKRVVAGKSPHRFAFFCGDPLAYDAMLRGKVVGETKAYGGHVEIGLEDYRLDLNDGITFKLLASGEPEPKKHQLYILFDDKSALSMSVQMYGALSAFPQGTNDNPYYLAAREKVSPLSDAFDVDYFRLLMDSVDQKKTSAKAFLNSGPRQRRAAGYTVDGEDTSQKEAGRYERTGDRRTLHGGQKRTCGYGGKRRPRYGKGFVWQSGRV